MKRRLTKTEKKRWYRYHKPGGNPGTSRCPVNPIPMGGGVRHELAKMRKYYELVLAGHAVLLEAVPNQNHKLRHDLVDLTDGVIYEVKDTCLSKNLDLGEVKVIEVTNEK